MPANPGNVLEVQALQCLRGDTIVFSNLSTRVAAGEVLQICGPNGSGKTSLLRILSGLAEPEAGEVLWRGESIASWGPSYRAAMHYVGHGNAVKLDLSVSENLQFVRDLDGKSASGPDLDPVLAQVRLHNYAHVPARRLSAGQRRRLALARLLVTPAMIWILDEPFTSLDSDGRALIGSLLDQHCGRGGIAVVATHQPVAMIVSLTTIEINLQ